MIRRAVLVAAAAVALILAPTAAMAQAPAGFSPPQVDSTPAVGVPFKVIASGAKANEAVTLTMTPDPASIGTRSLTQIANAGGVASFVVTLTADGTYLLVSKSASGVVLTSQTVTVSDHGAVIVAGTSAAAGTAASVTAGKASSAPAGKAVSAAAGTATSATARKAATAATGTAARGQLAFTGFGGMSLLVGVVLFVASISQGGLYILFAIVIVPIVTLIYLVLTRVSMEMVAIFFRIGENTTLMAASAGSADPTSEGLRSGLAGPYSGPTGPVSGPPPAGGHEL